MARIDSRARGSERQHDPVGDRGGRIVIDPFDPAGPAVERRRAGRQPLPRLPELALPVHRRAPADGGLTELVEVEGDEPFILHPGEFVLGQTLERVTLPNDLVARLEGKSSLGRLGLLIHSTAGFVDSGFSGNLTLELSNVANLPITIYHGMPIGQISFMRMDAPVEHPYGSSETGSKYQGQDEPTPSPLLPELRAPKKLIRGPVGPSTMAGPTTGRNHALRIGAPELIIVLVIVLVIFGPKRLPQLGRSLGGGMREFKDSVTGKDKDDEPDVIEGPDRSNVTTAAAADDEETETARRAREAKTADAS